MQNKKENTIFTLFNRLVKVCRYVLFKYLKVNRKQVLFSEFWLQASVF